MTFPYCGNSLALSIESYIKCDCKVAWRMMNGYIQCFKS